jgi:hypothetical protein
MTLRELFDYLSDNPLVVAAYFSLLLITAILAGIMGRGEGHLSPWKYLYSAIVYLVCVPGIFAAALAVQILLPGAGPVFAWPALLATLGLAIGARLGHGAPPTLAQVLPAAVLALPGLAMAGELFHFTFLGIGGPTPYGTVVLLVPVLALIAPLVPTGPRRPALIAAAVAVSLAAGIALWVKFDAVAPSVPPYAGTEKQQG